jgi:hypothetical protein
MPRIKRWFPVNHNINRDPEVWEMRRTIGEKSLSIWMEFLSIADQNEGQVPGSYDLSGHCQDGDSRVSVRYQQSLVEVRADSTCS